MKKLSILLFLVALTNVACMHNGIRKGALPITTIAFEPVSGVEEVHSLTLILAMSDVFKNYTQIKIVDVNANPDVRIKSIAVWGERAAYNRGILGGFKSRGATTYIRTLSLTATRNGEQIAVVQREHDGSYGLAELGKETGNQLLRVLQPEGAIRIH